MTAKKKIDKTKQAYEQFVTMDIGKIILADLADYVAIEDSPYVPGADPVEVGYRCGLQQLFRHILRAGKKTLVEQIVEEDYDE